MIEDRPAFGGCRSWVKLPDLPEGTTLKPVLIGCRAHRAAKRPSRQSLARSESQSTSKRRAPALRERFDQERLYRGGQFLAVIGLELHVVEPAIVAGLLDQFGVRADLLDVPLSMTTIWSADRIVERRCAMAITVRPAESVSSATWICFSDSESSAEVASSRSRIGAFLSRRARSRAAAVGRRRGGSLCRR